MRNLVITGDSLSYNRYGYDENMCMSAFDCHIGMPSWSFRLRNAFLTAAPDFCYADALRFTKGTFAACAEEKDAIFGAHCRAVTPCEDVISFEAISNNGCVTVYLQADPDAYCRFDVYVDGVLAVKGFDTYKEQHTFLGHALIPLELSCDKNLTMHEVRFTDFTYAEKPPCVTVAGVSSTSRHAVVTGQGSRTARFLLYHFEERIARYAPDAFVLIFGGNDCLFYPAEEYGTYLRELFSRMRERFPNCKCTALTIPPSAKLDREILGKTYTSDEEWQQNVETYNAQMRAACTAFDVTCLETAQVFAGISPKEWRFDNIHMTPFGNDLLFEAVKGFIG